MIRPENPTHGLKPFQMYSAGAERRETQNIFESRGQTHVNYKAHAGAAVGELAYLDAGVAVHTCLAHEFEAWASGIDLQAQAA